jgi:hypothetical protein
MRWQRLVVPAVVILVLAGGGWLTGQEGADKEKDKGGRPGFGRGGDFLKFFAKELNLNDKQMEQLTKLQEEFGPKFQKIQKEMRELRQQQIKAFEQILTDDQRKQFTELREKFRKGPKGPPAGAGAGGK